VRILPRRGGLLALGIVVLLAAVVVAVLVFDVLEDPEPVSDRRRNAAVTEADNGSEVTVPVGKPFVVDLKGSEDASWSLPSAVDASLALVSSSQDLDGSSSATFLPQKATPAALVIAERTLPCPVPGETCPRRTERFEVTIRVVG